MEDVLVSGVTYDRDEAKITLVRVPDQPGLAARIFGPIADANIGVDMIIQNASAEGTTDLTFTVPKADFRQALALVGGARARDRRRGRPHGRRTSPRCRSSGSACAATPASRPRCSARSPTTASTSR